MNKKIIISAVFMLFAVSQLGTGLAVQGGPSSSGPAGNSSNSGSPGGPGTAGGNSAPTSNTQQGSQNAIQNQNTIQVQNQNVIQNQVRTQSQLQNQQDNIPFPNVMQNQNQNQNQNRVQYQVRDQIDPSYVNVQARTMTQLRTIAENQNRFFQDVSASSSNQVREALQNQNRSRVATRVFLSAEEALGNAGPQIAQIAQQIQNSLQETVQAEVAVRERGFLANLFFGGDKQNTAVIQQELERNRARIQQLQQLMNQETIREDLRVFLQAHIRAMEEEQARIQSFTQNEQSRWGIFSWRF